MTWESLSEPWRACVEEAWAAYCTGSVPIGAAVTDADGRVVARGRNRNHEAGEGVTCYANHPLAHAEMNALIALDYAVHDPPYGCILYTTTEPCPLCFGAFYMSGLREVRFASRDPYAGSTNLLGATPYLSRKPIRVAPPSLPGLETLITALFAESGFSGGRDRTNPVLAAYEVIAPRALRLGEHLSRTGCVQYLREEGASASEMVRRVMSEYAALPESPA